MRADRRGQREDDVVVLDRQQIGLARLEPALCGAGLALRAMAVPARVVGDLGRAAASQRNTCPPSAALRHCSMADITFSCPRLSVPCASPRGPVGAEDVRDLQGGVRHAQVLLGTQVLQRADDFVQQIGGDLGVKRCGLKLLMAKQHLDHADVDLLFEQVRGKTVAQRMHRYALVDLCGFGGGVDGAVELPRAQRVDRIEPGKQPAAIGSILPWARATRHQTRSRSSSTGESIA